MKTKHFYYTETRTKTKYGFKGHIKVFKIVKNFPVLIGETVYNSGSTRGSVSEVLACLIENNEIDSKYAGYYHDLPEGMYRFHSLSF